MVTGEAITYDEILLQARRLAPTDQLRLLEDLAILLRQHMAPPRHRVTELRGLGSAMWQGIDAQEYVRQERASWDG